MHEISSCGSGSDSSKDMPGMIDPGVVPVSALIIPVKVNNILARAGIKTIKDLCAHSRYQLLFLKQFGMKSLHRVRDALLRQYGLSLREGDIEEARSWARGRGLKTY